jgi:hypothetical protein
VLTRPFAATAVPAFAYWILRAGVVRRDGRLRPAPALVAFVAVLAAGTALVMGINAHEFGSPLSFGYHELMALGAMRFDAPWADGVAGTFLSPLKSPLYFFPLIVAAPFAIALLLWRRDRIGVVVLLIAIPHVWLIPKYTLWDGGPDLFARFWLRMVPLTFLAAAAAVVHLPPRLPVRAAAFAGAALLVALGVRAQALAVATNEREIYADVARSLAAAGVERLDASQHAGALLSGRTPVARAQAAALDAPRDFKLLPGLASPRRRLGIMTAGLIAALIGAAGYCRRASAPPHTSWPQFA